MVPHYRRKAKCILSSLGIEYYDRVGIGKESPVYEGIAIPRPEIFDDGHATLRLDSGYNVGIRLDSVMIGVVENSKPIRGEEISSLMFREDLPYAPLMVTERTTTSRVNYPTEAVMSHDRPEELLTVPELAEIANIYYVPLFTELSSVNIQPRLLGEDC